jgi:hypothetical protein
MQSKLALVETKEYPVLDVDNAPDWWDDVGLAT